jgi:hypothetical protein
MVKIQLATGFLDVKEGTAFPLNFQIGDIRDVSQRKGNFSKTITLTGSKNNNNLLNHYYDVNIVEGTFNINALTTCAIIQDGIPIMEDCSMQLTGVLKTQLTDGYEEQVTYEVLVKDSKADFFTAITNKELTDIDFSDFNHPYDAFNVVARFSNTIVEGFKYFLPGSGDAVYNTQEFKPAIFAKSYFDRIFADAGFTYDWPTMSYDKFEKLLIPYNGGPDNFDYADYLVRAERTASLTLSSTSASNGETSVGTGNYLVPATKVNITGWTELEDPQNIFNPLTGVYTTPFIISTLNAQQYDYNITMSYQINIVNSNVGTCYGSYNNAAAAVFYRPYLSVSAGAQPLIPINLYTNPSPLAGFNFTQNAVQAPLTVPGLSTTNILTQNIQCTIPLSYPLLNNGQLGTLGISVVQQSIQTTGNNPVNNFRRWRLGSVTGAYPVANTLRLQVVISSIQITIVPNSTVYAIGGTIDVNDYVPKKIKQSDFIKGIFNMYNIYAQVDSSQPNKLLLQSRDDFYDSGAEVDWTAKLAKDQEQNLSFLPELTSKKIILTYAADKDNPNTTYTNATNNIYGQAEVIFDNEYVKEVTTKAVLFSPTPVIKTIFGAYVPMLAGSAPETNIRILYDKTTVGQPLATCGQFYIYDYQSVGQINLTSYPLVGHFDDPLTPTFDINFAICDYYYYQPTSLTENNLYNRYWRRTMGQINNGKMLTALFNLKEPDIQAMKLNDKIRIDNSWWNINKVIDYDANANTLTKVELISIDSEINFTPFMGPSGPDIPTPPAGIGPIQIMAMSNVNATRMMNSNVFSNQATATVEGRGNLIVGGTRSVVVGDNYIISDTEVIADSVRALSLNGVPTGTVPQIYIANLTQAGITDPIVQVKNNSLGDVTWTRTGVGTYEGYLDNYEPSGISSTNVPTIMINNVNFDGVISAQYSTSSNTVSVTTTQIGVGFVDGYLDGTTIEIKYYT